MSARGTRTSASHAGSRLGLVAGGLLNRHRNGLVHVLVCGGTEAARRAVAAEFHFASPLAAGPMVPLDAARDDAPLRAALERWIAGVVAAPAGDPLVASSRGTLFIDGVAALAGATQRLLLALAQRPVPCGADGAAGWIGRLVVGSPLDPRLEVIRGRLLAELCDCLDKIRVDLEPPASRRGLWRHEPMDMEEHERRSLCG